MASREKQSLTPDGIMIGECLRISLDEAETPARRRLAKSWLDRLTMEGERSAEPVRYRGSTGKFTVAELDVEAQRIAYEGRPLSRRNESLDIERAFG